MYLPITADDLFYKHRDHCGEIRNHIFIEDIVEVEVTEYDGDGNPISWLCDIDMRWETHGGFSDVYTFPGAELEDPDDYDGAKEYIVSQVQ